MHSLSETASRTSTTARAGSEKFSVPQEDAMVLYKGFSSPSTSRLSLSSEKRESLGEGNRRDVNLWTKAKSATDAARRKHGEDSFLPKMRKYMGESVDAGSPRGRMSGADGMSPRMKRPPVLNSVKVQRGKKTEIMPGSPRLAGNRIDESRPATVDFESPSMRKFTFSHDGGEGFRFPTTTGRTSIVREEVRFRVGWKP